MDSLLAMTARELSRRIRRKELSPVELIEHTLRRLEAGNPSLNAFVSWDAEGALAQARRLEAALLAGEPGGPLAGIPVGVKDLEDVAGMVTSFGSPLYRDNRAGEDSVQVSRLRAAGAIPVGKTNTPEFGYTLFTKNRLHGVSRNPWDPARTPGGSSGGSAAAVAAGLVPLATGTDAGGSVRIPAAYTGCFGLKPTLGRIPSGAFPGPRRVLALHPISVAGPLTWSVEDAALYLDCVAGHHPSDPISLSAPRGSYLRGLGTWPKDLRFAFSPDLGCLPVQRDVAEAAARAAGAFAELGNPVELWHPAWPRVEEAWSALLDCDLYSQLQDDLARRPGELNRSLVALLGTARDIGMGDLMAAQGARTELNAVLMGLFERYDLLITPTAPSVAFAAEGPPPSEIEGRTVSFFDLLGFTCPFNLSGHPAASVPAGHTPQGLTVGLQIVAPRQREDLLLRAARAYERARPWRRPRPTATSSEPPSDR